MQVCSLLQTDNHTSTPPLSFLQAGCPSCRPTNSVKALKARTINVDINQYGLTTDSNCKNPEKADSWEKTEGQRKMLMAGSPNLEIGVMN